MEGALAIDAPAEKYTVEGNVLHITFTNVTGRDGGLYIAVSMMVDLQPIIYVFMCMVNLCYIMYSIMQYRLMIIIIIMATNSEQSVFASCTNVFCWMH